MMGFKELAVHQESYCAIFSAGMSSACVVDVGAQETSVTCVDEGVVNSDTRITLNYGGDDVTIALKALLERASFPYRDLDLSKPQDWLMLDELKTRICTLEEHLVANTPWEFYVLSEGLTKKYMLRTYDENVLAPLCFFDTRMVDFDTKAAQGKLTLSNPNVDDLMKSHYDEPVGCLHPGIS
jgi:actin-related protein 8